MIPSLVDYVRVGTVDEAIAALTRGGEDAKIITGGQSLLPLLRMRLSTPSVLVDCARVAEMKGIKDGGDAVTVGAATTHWDVLHSDVVKQHVPLLAKTTAHVADPQIRHRGTLGGALAHGDPAGDLPAVAVALDATMTIAGPKGRREVAAKDFFVDYFTTAVGAGEVLVSVTFPKLGAGWSAHYEKFNRTAQGWAIVGVAAAVKVEGGKITGARIGLTNCASTPVRASSVEAALSGVPVSISEITAASQSATDGTRATSDLHADKEYREHLMRVLTARAVAVAAGA